MSYIILQRGNINVMQNELTEKIRSLLRIEDVIGRTVKLRKNQRGWSGLCPFHDDKSPSFHVYADTQTYYCFACHESGDIFTFVMKSQNLTFPEAVSLLAEEAGIDARQYRKQAGINGKSIYDVMNMAQEYFTSCLKKYPVGLAYLEKRGITAENAGAFGLGLSTNSWRDLFDVLSHRGISQKLMIDAGLVVQGSKEPYDRFRGRIMFPVRDIAGRIIAFGGRSIVPDVGAKYINSPESEIYRKRSNLYMLNTAGNNIREKGYSILCEGYMDAIRLHMAGFRESVASLGTSLTAEQARLLKRFADRCYICYDSDKAGQNASLRGMYILAENGLDVHIIRIPSGKDPDDFLRENPPESFRKAINDALPLIPYHIEMLRPELKDELRRKSALNDLWEGVKKLGADEALKHLGSLCRVFSLPPDEVKKRILEGRKIQARETPSTAHQLVAIENGLECAFCALLMRYSEYRLMTDAGKIDGLLTDDDAKEAAESIISDGADGLMDTWLEMGEIGKIGVITRGNILLSEMYGDNDGEKWQTINRELEILRMKRRLSEIYDKLSANTANFNEAGEINVLQKKLQELGI